MTFQKNSDMEILSTIEEYKEAIKLSNQKAMSLVNLGVEPQIAFEESISILEKIVKLLSSIEDEFIFKNCLVYFQEANNHISESLENSAMEEIVNYVNSQTNNRRG